MNFVFLVWQVLSFRLKKQTSKSVAGTTFKHEEKSFPHEFIFVFSLYRRLLKSTVLSRTEFQSAFLFVCCEGRMDRTWYLACMVTSWASLKPTIKNLLGRSVVSVFYRTRQRHGRIREIFENSQKILRYNSSEFAFAAFKFTGLKMSPAPLTSNSSH